MFRKLFEFCLLFLVTTSCAGGTTHGKSRQIAVHASSRREVIAVLMHLVQTKEFSGRWQLWNKNGHDPDRLDASGLPDIASIYHPRIGLYDVTDPDFIEYECQLLKMIGIDVVSIFVADASELTFKRLDLLLPKLAQYGLRAFPRFQSETSLHEARIIFEKFNASPAQWSVDGHPVISWFSFPANLTREKLAEFKSLSDPNPNIWRAFIGESTDSKWKGLLDTTYGWVGLSPRSVFPCPSRSKNYVEQCSYSEEIAGWELDLVNAAKTVASGKIRDYAIGISPGFDDAPVNGWNRCGEGALCKHQVERVDGKTYAYKWQKAVSSTYRFASIATFDDWGEASLIFPTVEFGNQYLELTKKYSALFKGSVLIPANFDVPEWIFRMKKKSGTTPKEIEMLSQADLAIARGEFEVAEQVVLPLAKKYLLLGH